jgi:hypothetical protein
VEKSDSVIATSGNNFGDLKQKFTVVLLLISKNMKDFSAAFLKKRLSETSVVKTEISTVFF